MPKVAGSSPALPTTSNLTPKKGFTIVTHMPDLQSVAAAALFIGLQTAFARMLLHKVPWLSALNYLRAARGAPELRDVYEVTAAYANIPGISIVACAFCQCVWLSLAFAIIQTDSISGAVVIASGAVPVGVAFDAVDAWRKDT